MPVGFIVGLSALGFLAFRRRKEGWILLAWLVTAYGVWSLVSNKNPRYILPALMVLPVAVAALPFRIPTVASFLSVFFSAWLTWGPAPLYGQLPQAGAWPLEEIVWKMVGFKDTLSVVTVVADHPCLNSNTVRWTVQKLGLEDRLKVRSTTKRLGQFSEFILMKTGDLGPAHTTGEHLQTREEILLPGGWFERAFEKAGEWNFTDDSRGILFRQRSVPVTTLDPSNVVPLLFSERETENLRVIPEGPRVFVTADRVTLRGLRLENVAVDLDGFWAVHDNEKRPRFLRLRQVHLKSARLTNEAATALLQERVKNMKECRVMFLEGNEIEASGRLGIFSMRTRILLSQEGPLLKAKLKKLAVGGFPLPVFLAGAKGEYVVDLTKPSRGMPFKMTVAPWKVIPGVLEVSDEVPHG
jgi:hypothetical protein